MECLLEQVISDAKAAEMAKGRSDERAEWLANQKVRVAISLAGNVSMFRTLSAAEQIAYKASYFATLGVTEDTACRFAAFV